MKTQSFPQKFVCGATDIIYFILFYLFYFILFILFYFILSNFMSFRHKKSGKNSSEIPRYLLDALISLNVAHRGFSRPVTNFEFLEKCHVFGIF